MASKKERTREHILDKAYELFAMHGFKAITMKDVCEATGLSRGGLYSHFASTQEIFEAILEKMNKNNVINFHEDIENKVPATIILNRVLDFMEEEMNHPEDSLSLAMYEYAGSAGKSEKSGSAGNVVNSQSSKKSVNDNMEGFSRSGEEKWSELIAYGISTGEFHPVKITEMVNIILFSYQGIRMWSRIATVEPERVKSVTEFIKRQLLKGDNF